MNRPRHDSPFDDSLAVAIRAARRATDVIRERAGQVDEVRAKARNDFVTDTDEAAQDVIVDVLKEAFPQDDVLAEEGAEDETHPPTGDGRRWIVDPLDGTTNFVQQVPPYAVSIALQEESVLRVAAILEVTQDELFTAVSGYGAQLDGQEIHVTDTTDFSEAFVATGFPYKRFEHTDAFLQVLGSVIRSSRGVRRHGSASVDLARLACGRFDAFFETGLRPWDVAAGALLVREAGGRVTNYHDDGGLTPLFDRQMCATNGPLHNDLLAHVDSMQDIRL